MGLISITSCKTPENVAYFQDLYTGSVVQAAQVLEVKVKPEDKLSIVVTTQDPALSALFNLVTAQNRVGTTSSQGSTNSGQMSYYTVDSNGDIDFPVVGKIHIAGLTREEVAEKIVDELVRRNLVKNPIVTVEFANQCVVVLGEVKQPGKYNFNEDHITILEALAMAGDLTINGMRDNVLVMRKTSEGMQKAYRVDLTHAADLASSPVYYLQQDDVVYIEPDDKKKRETTPNGNTPYTPSFWVSMGSFGVTIATLIITLTK
ncbi:MAG: polysaccharide export protein [Muribaculaceae bacterium]|nr:polysaccharide export protein [Muribaculaceae bacterium]MDE6321112.1 polysaccharide export protein [Muribaculaceae bacterium]